MPPPASSILLQIVCCLPDLRRVLRTPSLTRNNCHRQTWRKKTVPPHHREIEEMRTCKKMLQMVRRLTKRRFLPLRGFQFVCEPVNVRPRNQ